MKILVTGKDGQLGIAFQKEFDGYFENEDVDIQVHYVGRQKCDLSNLNALEDILNKYQPNVIINAAAYTAVDRAEQESGLAFTVNSAAVASMAQYSVANGASLLHFSTDYVFDGLGADFYSENHPVSPLGVYGKSKAEGERLIAEAFSQSNFLGARYAIFRTSWIYGEGENFIRTILLMAKDHHALKVIDDQHGVPTCASWLAQMTLALSIDRQGIVKNFPSGIYHGVPKGETTWLGLACMAIQASLDEGVSMKALPSAIQPILTTEHPLAAQRPMNSRLATQKLQTTLENLGYVSKFPIWDELVRTYVAELVKNQFI
jgi:dTDP-4-dehydrorhamnose reductase